MAQARIIFAHIISEVKTSFSRTVLSASEQLFSASKLYLPSTNFQSGWTSLESEFLFLVDRVLSEARDTLTEILPCHSGRYEAEFIERDLRGKYRKSWEALGHGLEKFRKNPKVFWGEYQKASVLLFSRVFFDGVRAGALSARGWFLYLHAPWHSVHGQVVARGGKYLIDGQAFYAPLQVAGMRALLVPWHPLCDTRAWIVLHGRTYDL